MLGERGGVLRESVQEARRPLLLEVDGNGLRVGARQEQQLVDDLVHARELLELHVHGFPLRRLEVAGHQHALRVQAHEGKRRLELVRGVRGEAPDLVEGSLEAVEHLVEQAREVRDLVLHGLDGDAFPQVVGADPVRGRPDRAHRAQYQAAQPEPDGDAHEQHDDEQRRAHLHIARHHVVDGRERRGHGDLEGRQQEFAHAQRPDPRDLRGIGALSGNVGNRLAVQVAGLEEAIGHRPVHVDVEERRGRLGGVADALVHDQRRERLVVVPERGLQLPELRLVEEIELPDEVVLQHVVAGDEHAGERRRRGDRIPDREPGADRLHSSW